MKRRLYRYFVSAFLSAACQAQQPTTIRVPVRLVAVPTLVLSKQGRVIDGLVQSDFSLSDNGHPENFKLETGALPLSVVLAIQTNDDVREYLPFVANVGSVVDAMLVAQTGEAAVISYNAEVTVLKPFNTADVAAVLRNLSSGGQPARLIDAGLRAIDLLKGQPGTRSRVVLFIGQPADHGSNATLSALLQKAANENITIDALTLPEWGKSFVSDSFRLSGLGDQKGGYKASVELNRLLPALNRSAKAIAAKDPISVLTFATGGVELPFRKQTQLEDALTLIGQELRSLYLLTYSPDPLSLGEHTIHVEVNRPEAKVFSRPGYSVTGNRP